MDKKPDEVPSNVLPFKPAKLDRASQEADEFKKKCERIAELERELGIF